MTSIFSSGLSDYLRTTWSSYTRLVKKCKQCYVDFLFYFYCYLLRAFSRTWVRARVPLGSPQLSQRMKCSCASKGCCNAQCPLPPQEESGVLGWTSQLTLQCVRSAGCLGWNAEQAVHRVARHLNQLVENAERQMFISPSVWPNSEIQGSNQCHLWTQRAKRALKLTARCCFQN